MKLLLVNHFPLEGSGSGVYVRNLARELVLRGHEVQVLAPEYALVDTSAEGFATHTVLFSKDGAETEIELDEGVRLSFPFPCFTTHPRSHFTFYEMNQGQISAYKAAFHRKLIEILDAFDPDLIHVGHLWILADLVRESGRPYVVTSHGTDLMGFRRDKRFRQTALNAAAGACRVITISRQSDAEVEALLGVTTDRRALIYSGCDATLFNRKVQSPESVLSGFGLEDKPRFIVSFAGKLVDFKGVDVLLDAAANYESQFSGQILTVIAGEGIDGPRLKARAEALGLKGVRFVGHRTQRELAALYSVSDVFAMPSRSEPFGLAALEAMACGLPVVGTCAGGLPDMIGPEVGRLVPVDDATALSEAILSVLTLNGDDKSALRERCIQRVETEFSWEATARHTERVYLDCLKWVDNGGTV